MKLSRSGSFRQVAISIIFFVSGISGLIYETIWLRMLSRIVGNTVYASSIVLAAFMLGLSLGSLFIGRSVDKRKDLLRFYAVLEFGIAISAVLVFFLLKSLVPVFQFFHAIFDDNTILYRGTQAFCVFFLLVLPTFMMGATLPVLSAESRAADGKLIRNMSLLYGLNTLGAVVGVVLSGFYTIGAMGELNSMWLGFGLNLIAAVSALTLRRFSSKQENVSFQRVEEDLSIRKEKRGSKAVVYAYFLIGFTSFALELVWTRLFQIQVGTSIYAFSMVLAIYLLGSSLGSLIGARYFQQTLHPLRLLSMCLAGIAIYTLLGCYFYVLHLPVDPGKSFGFDTIFLPVIMVFPITFLLGLCFPLVMQVYVGDRSRIAGLTGRLYAFNTMGCILGSLLCGYLFIQFFGTRNTIIFLSLCNLVLAGYLYFQHLRIHQRRLNYFSGILILIVVSLLSFFAPDPFYDLIYKIVHSEKDKKIFYHKEGVVATTTSFGSTKDKTDRQILINGIGMTALVTETKIMSHLPILLHPGPKKMLVICFGMGTAVRSALTHRDLDVDVVELVGEEYEAFHHYHDNAKEVLANKHLRTFTDDGRNFLLMHQDKYDVIVLDPAPPLYSAGTVNLYTRDFFELCKSKLNKNGIMCLWIPPDIKSEIRMIMGSFKSVFPDAPAYTGINYPGFYLLGSVEVLTSDERRFADADLNPAVMEDLNEWGKGFRTSSQLLDLKIMTSGQMDSLVKGAPLMTDDHPYTEFPIWRSKKNPEYKQFFSGNEFKKKYPD